MRCDIVATLVIDYRQGRTQNAEVHHPPPRGNLPRQGDLRANMRCSHCRFENPPGFKFCGQCTTPLVPGAPVPHLSKSSISIRERDSAETLDGERKTVTALFADIKGSMELMEDLDPEEARAIVDPALRL